MQQGATPRFLRKYRLELCFVLIVLFTIALKLPSLRVHHGENDERIYVTLAKKMAQTGEYNLRGTPLLEQLAPEMYDRSLFFQPPLFVLLSIPLVLSFGDNAPVVLSWAGHLLVLLSLFLFSRKILEGRSLMVVLVVALAAVDPILMFTSKKIWLDAPASGLAALSMYVYWRACLEEGFKSKIRYALLASVILGAAVMTKVPAVLVAPFFALFYFKHCAGLPGKKGLQVLLASALPVLVITFPWFLLNYIHTGKLIDTPILPQTLIDSSRYIRRVIDRPSYYYLKEVVLLTPVIVFPFIHSLRFVNRLSFLCVSLWITLFSVIGGYTYFAVAYDQAYVMRYLAPIGLPFYLLLGLYVEDRMVRDGGSTAGGEAAAPALFKTVLCLLTLILSAMTSVLFIFRYDADELFSVIEILARLK